MLVVSQGESIVAGNSPSAVVAQTVSLRHSFSTMSDSQSPLIKNRGWEGGLTPLDRCAR